MGTCYSTHSRPINISTSEMPHDSSVSDVRPEKGSVTPLQQQQPAAQFGFRKPYGGRYGKAGNSNEQSSRGSGGDVKRSPLATVSDTPTIASVPSSQKSSAENLLDNAPKRFGFGFKAPTIKKSASTSAAADANKNSQESLNSISATAAAAAADSSAKRDSIKSNPRRLTAYDPKDKHASLESWRMIDDSSTAESVSSSGGGDRHSSRRTVNTDATISEEDVKNANVGGASQHNTPVSIKSSSSTSTITGETNNKKSSANGKKSSPGSGGGSKLQSRLRGPLAKFYASRSVDKTEKADNWVRASSTSAAEVKPGKAATQTQQQKKPGGVQGFLRRGLLRKQKSAPVEPSPSKSTSQKDNKDKKSVKNRGVSTASSGEGDSPVKEESRAPDNTAPRLGDRPALLKLVGTGAHRMFDIPPGKAPIAMIDSIETTSIGSITSDDLMLETDIPLDDYEELGPSPPNSRHQSSSADPAANNRPRSRKNSKSRPRSRSHSRDSLDAAADTGGRKPGMMQRSVSDTRAAALSKTDGGVQRRSNKNVSLDSGGENEPLQELVSLLDKNNTVSRRNPRLHRASRPASFPGWKTSIEGEGLHAGGGSSGGTPTGSSTTPTEGSKVLKPPRQPSVDDAEVISVDAVTYRQMQTDLTQFKTMLLKLKRLMHDDEIGTPIGQPFNQSWGSKNGFKQLGGSQPGSPFCQDENKRFSFTEKESSPEGPSLDAVMNENGDLKHQLQMLQHQVEEQERTIRLLQQQMTKYECGHVGPGGKVYSHSASQTDKPRLPISKSVFESGSSRRVESSESQPVVRYRTELSSSLKPESEESDDEEIGDSVFMPGVDVDYHDNVNDDERGDELGRIDNIDGQDECNTDNTDRDVRTFSDDDTHVLSSSTSPLREEIAKTSPDVTSKTPTDTVTSVTFEDIMSSLSSPSSDLDGLSSELLDGSPMKSSDGLLSESELLSLQEEFSRVAKIQSTPMVARIPANVTYVADVITPDSDGAGSIHDFNVQTAERLENYTTKSLVRELEEAEEELSHTESLSQTTELQQTNGHKDLNNTFTVSVGSKKTSVNGNSKPALNSTFTMPGLPGNAGHTASHTNASGTTHMVRSETHSSGYQSDVMVTSTTSSDAMATSATSGDVMVSSAGSGDVDNNNDASGVNKDRSKNGFTNESVKEPKSRLMKPKLSGLQRPKFSGSGSSSGSVNNNNADKSAEENRIKPHAKDNRQMVPPSAVKSKLVTPQFKPTAAQSRLPSSGLTAPKSNNATPADNKLSKLPSALPKFGKGPGYGGVGSAKPNSKLPSFGGGKVKSTGGRNSHLKPPAKTTSH